MEKIIGVGVDCVECDRVLEACKKESFLKRCFTQKEQELFQDKMGSAATNFAAKEAVVKAFGTGFHGIVPREVEILRNDLGAPYVVLHGNAQKKAEEIGIETIHISLSDTKKDAMAFVVAIGK